jgi:hypothetical protein
MLKYTTLWILATLTLAGSLDAQSRSAFDRSALVVAAATGVDPSDTALRHHAIGVAFSYRAADRLHPHAGVSRLRFAPMSCPTPSCMTTATELGVGFDYVVGSGAWLDLMAGPTAGYIQQRSDSRFTWKLGLAGVLAPRRAVAPRIDVAWWSDPDHGRQGVFAALGVRFALGSAGGPRTADGR